MKKKDCVLKGKQKKSMRNRKSSFRWCFLTRRKTLQLRARDLEECDDCGTGGASDLENVKVKVGMFLMGQKRMRWPLQTMEGTR